MLHCRNEQIQAIYGGVLVSFSGCMKTDQVGCLSNAALRYIEAGFIVTRKMICHVAFKVHNPHTGSP